MLFDSFEAYDVQAVRKESRETGRAEGALKTIKEMIFSLLEDFGSIPEDVKNAVLNETNMDTLKVWYKLAAKATSMDDFKINIKPFY